MNKKILLIEDNLEMRENTAEILELANYEVLTADHGKAGVKMAKSEKPDLIVCDIMMPEMDGYEVLYLLGKDPQTAGVPFIFLTAKAEKTDVRKGMTLGADDYVTKPFEEMELLEAIESRLKRNEILQKDFGRDESGLTEFIDEARGIEALQDLSRERKTRQYKKKDTIYFEGDYPNYVLLITRGKVKTWRLHEDGKELVTGLHQSGAFLGYTALLENSPHQESAAAIEDSEMSIIPKDDFLALLHKNRDVAVKFIRMLSNNIHSMEERLLSLAYSSVRERVAETLLQIHEDNPADDPINISREDLAGMVGTATESLIRTLSDFKDEQLISIEGRQIQVVNPDKLRRIAHPF